MSKEYKVRLIKGFQLPQGHRRAGYQFLPGQAQTVELDDSQKELIDKDPVLEFLDGDSDVKTVNTHEDTHSAQSEHEGSQKQPVRAYEGEANENLMSLNRDQLNTRAKELGVESPEKLGSKQEVIDAIQNKE